MLLTIACGSDSPASDISFQDASNGPVITRPDDTFTIDSVVNAGWKKSKQYDDISTVPEATEVYFGFFSAKDIEVRIYASHEAAARAGGKDAAEDIDQSFREGGQFGSSNRGAGSSAVTKFKAFAVVGNTVMLCEQSVEACVALADVLGG